MDVVDKVISAVNTISGFKRHEIFVNLIKSQTYDRIKLIERVTLQLKNTSKEPFLLEIKNFQESLNVKHLLKDIPYGEVVSQ